jgi:hypothetical protein
MVTYGGSAAHEVALRMGLETYAWLRERSQGVYRHNVDNPRHFAAA